MLVLDMNLGVVSMVIAHCNAADVYIPYDKQVGAGVI